MTVYAGSAAPPNALTIWSNGKVIFVELPTKRGPPYIISYQLTEGGLSKALDLLRTHADHSGAPMAGDPSRSNLSGKVVGTETQRAQAQAVLRKMGIIR